MTEISAAFINIRCVGPSKTSSSWIISWRPSSTYMFLLLLVFMPFLFII